MTVKARGIRLVSLLALLLSIISQSYSWAQNNNSFATLYSLEGQAQKLKQNASVWSTCVQGETFEPGDQIKVGEHSRAGIQFVDGYFVRLSSKASLKFGTAKNDPKTSGIFLGSGKAHFFNRGAMETPQIETAVVSAAIRGTEFVVEALTTSTLISVLEGSVYAQNSFGSLSLSSGEQALTEKGQAPRRTVTFSPADAVQWTASIPVIFQWGSYGTSPSIDRIRQLVGNDQLTEALDLSSKLGKASNENIQVLTTDLLLSLGQIDQAASILDKLSWRSLPSETVAHVHAQKSLIALTRNEIELADKLASAANSIAPQSSSSALALSYVFQSQKDLSSSRSIIEAALDKSRDEPMLLTRLAEIELGFGNVNKAFNQASKALITNPGLAYAQTILGFVELFRKNISKAKELFQASAQKSPGSGLAFLGLGLAEIHDGNLKAGRHNIERAVDLEPGRAIFRSYLGKVFFEMENENLAEREYNEAIRLDPLDPTPWLYRGFYNISKNQIVAAITDVEKSFALNKSRAVFRSSLLLDEDLAVRSAGLSRIFSELGFEQRGRLEAIDSLSIDPTNFSAHRLLADNQQEIFFADAAFSERRIADLLAPLSFNLFSGLGGNASLNEYDALFDMSQRRTSTLIGYNQGTDALTLEASHAGKEDNIGYAIGTSTEFGNGTKHANYKRDYRLDGALRFQLAPDHRLLIDAHGIYNKEFDFAAEDQTTRFDLGDIGLGYSYRFSPSTVLLAEAVVGREKSRALATGAIETIDSTQIYDGLTDTVQDDLFLDRSQRERVRVLRGGSQLLYRGEDLALVTGFQVLSEKPNRSEEKVVFDDSLGELTDSELALSSSTSSTLTGTDLYFYPTWHALRWLDLTVGATRSDIDQEYTEISPFADGTVSQGRWNPKVGLVARPLPNLTLRSAYFETLHKASLEDQTSIEPTLIGGITQRFNDLSGTQSRNIGIGADYKVPGSTYFGAEYLRRYPTEKHVDSATELIVDFDKEDVSNVVNVSSPYDLFLEQDFARAYVYQIINQSLVASVDYLYATEEVTDPELSSDFLTHRASLQLKYFHSNGIFAFARGTWRMQHGVNNPYLPDDNESAWMFDAGLGYRLPKRRGSLRLELLNLTNEKTAFDQSHGFENLIAEDITLRAVVALNF